jgi:hypothetical protein
MATTTDIFSIVGWLAVGCFCGILPLGFAAILFFTSRKRGQVGQAVGSARKATTATLRPGMGLVRLQGRIAAQASALDGSAENALVYLRLKVEIYITDSDGSGWRGMTDKTRGMPFQLEDDYGTVWVNPDGLDKQLLGDGIVPDENQIQAACILLGISLPALHSQLRFRLWELRAGQNGTVIGCVAQGQTGMEVRRVQGQPFIVSPLPEQAVESSIVSQTKKASTWTWVLGILGAIMLLCGLGGALIALVRLLVAK